MFDSFRPTAGFTVPPSLETHAAPETPRRDHLIGGAITTFRAGQQIYAEGDHSGPLFQVAYGMVRIYRVLSDGRRQICAFQLPGEIFGLERDGERRFFANAIVKTGLQALRRRADLDPPRELLEMALSMLGRAQDHALTLGCQSAVGRVSAFILEMAERQHSAGDGIVALPMTRADIGDYLGLTIESVSRSLSKLRAAGVIRMPHSHRLDIARRDALKTFCE